MDMEKNALQVLKFLNDNGFAAYLVGGCVRDKVLHLPVQDFDIATNAHPQQVMQLFERSVPTGLQHGTVTVILHGFPFEVTTFRREGKYNDFRRPDEVEFVDTIEEDLARRDFTINAMAMDGEGKIIDPFDGRGDIVRKCIRCVGEAKDRFGEDALRMVRGVRFAARYGFDFAPETWQGLLTNRLLITRVAVERIADELHKWLKGPRVERGYQLFAESRLFSSFAWGEKLFASVSSTDKLTRMEELELANRWSLLFLHAEIPVETADKIMQQLRFSRVLRGKVNNMLKLLAEYRSDETWWKSVLLDHGKETAGQFFALLVAWGIAPFSKNHWEQLQNEMPVLYLRDLAVTGQDLLEDSGKQPGPWIATTLRRLLFSVNFQSLPNEKEALLAEARKEIER